VKRPVEKTLLLELGRTVAGENAIWYDSSRSERDYRVEWKR